MKLLPLFEVLMIIQIFVILVTVLLLIVHVWFGFSWWWFSIPAVILAPLLVLDWVSGVFEII